MIGSKEIFFQVFNELIPFHKTLGLRLEDVSEGFAKVLISFNPTLVGDPRIQAMHGGVLASAMDAAGGLAGMTTLTSMEDKISTIDMRIDYLRSARACDIWVEGQVTRNGNRIVATYMKAYKEDGTVVAEGRGVYNVSRKNDPNKDL